MNNYVAKGYSTPTGINSREKVMQMQRVLGVKADGIWGKNTQAAFDAAYAPQNKGRSTGMEAGLPGSTANTGGYLPSAQQKNFNYGTSGGWRERMQPSVTKFTGSNAASSLPPLKQNSVPLGVNEKRTQPTATWRPEPKKQTPVYSQNQDYFEIVEEQQSRPVATPTDFYFPEEEKEQESIRFSYSNPYYEIPDDNPFGLGDPNRVAQNVKLNATWVTPPEEWQLTPEHKRAIDQYYGRYWDAMDRTKAEDWLSPDPLGKEAAACLIIINELQNQLNAQYKNGLPVTVNTAELMPLLYDAYEAYASIPILLSEDTLRNPYAMRYADELSTRILMDRQDEKRNNEAIRELRFEVDLRARMGDMAGYVWSTKVLNALRSKTNFDTVAKMLANDYLLGFPEKSWQQEYENSTTTNAQLNYMATMDYRRQANPYLASTMDAVLKLKEIVGNVNIATSVMELVKNKNIKEAIKLILKEGAKKGFSMYNGK